MNSHDLELDKTPLTFGKYAGLTPDQISEIDPGYVVWLYRTIQPQRVSTWLYEVCLNDASDDSEDDTDEVW